MKNYHYFDAAGKPCFADLASVKIVVVSDILEQGYTDTPYIEQVFIRQTTERTDEWITAPKEQEEELLELIQF